VEVPLLKTIVEIAIADAAAPIVAVSRNLLWRTFVEHLVIDWG
jgi:hypothetical protein